MKTLSALILATLMAAAMHAPAGAQANRPTASPPPPPSRPQVIIIDPSRRYGPPPNIAQPPARLPPNAIGRPMESQPPLPAMKPRIGTE